MQFSKADFIEGFALKTSQGGGTEANGGNAEGICLCAEGGWLSRDSRDKLGFTEGFCTFGSRDRGVTSRDKP